ncbi:GNAT family N-acetyltransferase [Ruminococcus sp.]|uniref:GNAT family N-acetyltransferase n=1 Tax=Ruminococcus sp. TaxID=41978 RepID=UPI0025DCD66B|nr:GNAT family N-acetyltransferase [Ruminococcus sp.]MBO4524148.1 GNAT family N-acetyltransferase [Ruminococcus sp.]
MEIKILTNTHEKWESVATFAENCSWRAGKYLANLMRINSFKDWERVFAAFDGDDPMGFCTLTEKDELDPKYPYSPLIGFVFVDESFRGRRISEKMIHKAIEYSRSIGYNKIYVMSSEKGLYEKYGFVYIGDYENIYNEKEQLFMLGI